jgi:hypothetical protein
MRIGDCFETDIRMSEGSFEKLKYQVCSIADLMALLRETSGSVTPFDDAWRRCVGFSREGRALAVMLMEVKNNLSVLPDWFRDDISTPEGRRRIAERCSA